MMKVDKLSLTGAKLLSPRVFKDARGFFFESYREDICCDAGLPLYVQDNHSHSTKGVIRGMHFQSEPGQAKLVRVAVRKIYDVIVDIRKDSPTYRQWEGVYLDAKSHMQLFVPVGFANGFQVVSDEAHVLYKVSSPYSAATEKGFRFDDPDIAIKWPEESSLISERDLEAPFFKELT